MNVKFILFCIALSLTLTPVCGSQTVGATVLTGTPAFQSYDGGPDTINEGNLNINWNFPIINKPGRGTPFTFNISYDSSMWSPVSFSGTSTWAPVGQFGWNTGGTGYYTYTLQTGPVGCGMAQTTYAAYYTNFVYYDANNTAHPFNISTSAMYECADPTFETYSNTPTITSATGTSLDGQGYIIVADGNNATITTPKGLVIIFPTLVSIFDSSPTSAGQSIYANGNTITHTGASFTDTLNTTALTVTGGMVTPPMTMTYTGPSGPVEAVLNYATYPVQTNFQCPGVVEYVSVANSLPSSLSLPDGRSYTFGYEPTPGAPTHTTGRIASVTLPSGGVISYTYSGGSNGINCSDGSAMTITRTISDGTTTYARSNITTATSMTTITHPPYQGATDQTAVADQTVVNFVESGVTDTGSYDGLPGTQVIVAGPGFYEIERQDYHGSAANGTLLRTVLGCWNGVRAPSICSNTTGENTSSIPADALPYYNSLYSHQVTVQWPDHTGISSGYIDSTFVSLGSTSSNNPLTPLSHVVYDYGTPGSGTFSATPLQTVTTSIGGLGPGGTYFPSEVKVTDGSGNTISDTQYAYDETTPTASGAPQLTAGYTYGNVTTVKQWVSGTTYLTSHNNYYDDGLVYQATDVNGSVTTYSYGACGDAFPTSVTTGGLSTSANWDCNGGVMTSSKDANGFTTTYNYGSDPFWRLESVTDPLSNVTNYIYPSSSSNTSSSTMTFNGSISGSRTSYDSLGRAIIQQTPTSPSQSTYNSVQISYDSHGRPACQSIPYSASAGGTTFGASNCTFYDPLNRTSIFTDASGGTIAYSYNANDVLVTIGPAPSGENTKARQLEYNGAGWLTSVCEVTSLSGSGSCGQNTAAIGYLTQYKYNGGGNLLTVNQNVQAGSGATQTRSLTYDGLGRKTSELIPEWTSTTTAGGTGTYAYDSDSSGVCSGSYPGDMVKSVDNAGNVTCNTYDLLHRVLSSTVASGPYASVTPQNNYVYDAANSILPVLNAKGSLAEAYTSFVGSTTKLTDVYFSKYPSGNSMVSQMWESTPHSSGYMITQETAYPNGTLAAVSASQIGAGTNATGNVTVSGYEHSSSYFISDPCASCRQYGCPPCPQYGYIYDSGSVGITVNGMSVSTGYGQNSTSSSVASGLINAINSSSTFPVTATALGSVITLTSKVPGPSINYTVSGSTSTSFTVSSGTVSGGTNTTLAIGPAVTYTIDSAGRPYSATDGTHSLNLVTSTAYNVASSPTSVTFGNASTGSGSDIDSFGYDPNTNRPTSFTYTVKPTSSTLTVAGNLTWNANGSLAQMTYNDSSDTTKNQNCAYSADDLSRISSVNCGNATWAQNFSYDAFGNINKTVPSNATGGSYTAAYSPITNHVSSGISPLPNYDGIGNQLNSTGATLTWNAAAQPITVNGTAANYDALGRMVETGASSVPSVTYDSGTLTMSIQLVPPNGEICTVSVGYTVDSTPASLAPQLVNQINASACASYSHDISAALSGSSTVAITNTMVNYQWTDTIQVSSTHSAQFSSPSFSFSSSSASINDGQTAYFNITGSDQSSVTVPSCTGCKQFFFRPDGTQLGIYSGGLVKETIPLPGGETAVYNGSGLNFIRHTDYLGSSRLATTWAHAVYSKEAYAPFGETYNEAGTPDRSFTGQDQDVASGAGGTGTYDFLFRKYDPAAGRWLSPDPAGWGVVDQTAPQSLNRYAYVLNDPLALTDQNGTCWQTVTYSNSFNGGQVSNEDWSYDDGTGPCASDPGATLGASPGNGSTNSGGGSSGGSSSTQTAKVCFIPNPVEQTGIALQQKLANWLGYPVGVGMGVSGGVGFGKFFGFYATTSYQMVVTPTGNAYRVYTSGGTGITQNWLTPVTKGGGITGGFQVSSMTTQNPSDLSGYALNASAGGGRGWGGGGDVSVTGTANGSLVAQGTGTGPFGYGAFGGGGAITKTTVIPSCSNQ